MKYRALITASLIVVAYACVFSAIFTKAIFASLATYLPSFNQAIIQSLATGKVSDQSTEFVLNFLAFCAPFAIYLLILELKGLLPVVEMYRARFLSVLLCGVLLSSTGSLVALRYVHGIGRHAVIGIEGDFILLQVVVLVVLLVASRLLLPANQSLQPTRSASDGV